MHIIKSQGFLIYVVCDKDRQIIRRVSDDSYFLGQVLHRFRLLRPKMEDVSAGFQ